MKILSISPSLSKIEFALYKNGFLAIIPRAEVKSWMNSGDAGKIAEEISSKLSAACGCTPDHVCIRLPSGGAEFSASNVPADAEIFARLARISYSAPLHIPQITALCKELQKRFGRASFSFAAENAFFSCLPEREAGYAISDGAVPGQVFRRTGHHGLFHEAAFRSIFEKQPYAGTERVISICLEPVPEITAIIGGSPIMVTGGATPLEGIPGETTCGEIDPFIVINLSKKLGWGPEQINKMLAEESGILGLTGSRIGLGKLLQGASRKYDMAKKILLYRIIQSCGAAAAAMGGADFIVFSGRYASAGKIIGPMIRRRLPLKKRPAILMMEKPLLEIVASSVRRTGKLESCDCAV